MGFSPNPWYIGIDNPQAFKENVPVAMHQQAAGYDNARFCWVSTMTFDELDFWQRWTQVDHGGKHTLFLHVQLVFQSGPMDQQGQWPV
jgi:hypothetical protein